MNEEYKRDTEYWNDFYKSKKANIVEHSLFAEYIMEYLKTGCELLDIGCGNGRDSIWFANNGVAVTCIDASNVAIESIRENAEKEINAICGDFVSNDVYNSTNFDVVYSRFSVHAIDEEQERVLFSNVFNCLREDGIFAIEVRSIHDELYKKGRRVERNAYIFEGHYRRFIEINELIGKLTDAGFSIQYAEENRNFAPFMNSNPLVIRVVAKKGKKNKGDYLDYLLGKYSKLIVTDGIDEKRICNIVGWLEKRQLMNWRVVGTEKKRMDSSLYTLMSERQLEIIKELINTYEMSDKVILISNEGIHGALGNYEKTDLLTEEEVLQALLYK